MVNYGYLLSTNANPKTLISFSGSESDMKPQQGMGPEHAGMRRLQAISTKVSGYNLLAVRGLTSEGYPGVLPRFFHADSYGNVLVDKVKMQDRMDKFVSFYLNLCQEKKLNPTSNVLVGITDSTLFAFYLGLFHHSLFKKVVLITPNPDFYIHLNKQLSIWKDDKTTLLNQFTLVGNQWSQLPPKTFKDIFKSMNLFIYSKKDRYKYTGNNQAGKAQDAVLSELEKQFSYFYYHFKYEGLSSDDYKIKLNEFLKSPSKGKSREENRFKNISKSKREKAYA